MADEKRIEGYEVVDHGMDSSDSFPGIGTSGTEYDEVVVGVGTNPKEAFDDALEQIHQGAGQVDTSKLEQGEAGDYKETPSVMYNVSFQFDYEKQDNDEDLFMPWKAAKNGTVDTSVDLRSSEKTQGVKELDDDGASVYITVWDSSPDSAAERIEQLLEENPEYQIKDENLKELRKIARYSEPNMYYYIGIRYTIGSPREISFQIKKLDMFGKDTSKGARLKEPSKEDIIKFIEESDEDTDTVMVYSDDPQMGETIKEWLNEEFAGIEVASNSSGVVVVWHE